MGSKIDFLAFSKRERVGIIMLIVLIGIVFVLPEFVPIKNEQLIQKRFSKLAGRLKL